LNGENLKHGKNICGYQIGEFHYEDFVIAEVASSTHSEAACLNIGEGSLISGADLEALY
jgi:hypothetical protein